MELPLTFYIVGAAAVVLVGIAKAGFGGGVGVIATPLLLLAAPAELPAAAVVAILLPILVVCDWFSIAHYYRTFDRRLLLCLLPGAIVGIAVGTLLMSRVGSASLKIGIGLLSVLFVLDQLVRPWVSTKTASWPANGATGAVFGSLAGFASMLAHAGGPPATIFLLPHFRDRRIFVGTTVVFFTIVNATKLLPYYWLDLFDFTNLAVSLLLLPLVPVGVWAGVWMNRRMNDRVFRAIVYTLLFATGVKLIWDGIGPS